jgi:hypothetical protein
LSATAQVNVDWESHPAPGRKSTDSTLLVGLSYAWRRPIDLHQYALPRRT